MFDNNPIITKRKLYNLKNSYQIQFPETIYQV